MPSTSQLAYIAGNGIGLVLAGLYTVAGQAHFTNRLTPGLAANINEMTHNTHKAFWFLGLGFENLKMVLGGFDLLGAAYLWRAETRRTGLLIAVVGFSGGLYGQIYNQDDLSQVGLFLGLAVAGYYLLSSSSGRPENKLE
ncbi:hypothetical protein M409DRAFT_17483 [Zasmidium cellare ATCC 36951]|uniref:Uncharacterized protein n=1 Tax=Zasmidium cellare ATCC 36951 TaxID=1080233 RepID=A0A6A6D3L4_ZASCE|nr:uncharacterized protein M409DRAFT_17483 [Zasmidium cellare ATCC 36951]KAF2172246.1 hypothetical protein M409DRAFT_17483 [Zasmidium cellare ATCC 36951]